MNEIDLKREGSMKKMVMAAVAALALAGFVGCDKAADDGK